MSDRDADRDALDGLADAVADGTPVDWDRIESEADHRSRDVIRNLRTMAAMASLHRTLSDDTDALTDGTPAGGTSTVPLGQALPSWGHFALEQRIGSGSFGDVFRAIDTRLDRVVAVKLARDQVRDPDASLIEARLLARVRHPNVASVYGADVFGGRPGLWMEFIEGQTLSTVLQRQGALGEAEATLIGLDLCRALSAVHEAGLLHRDIKAQNVMRELGGRIVLMDFGGGRDIAARRQVGGDTGTPLYLAPEVLAGQAATARSDIYALGVLLYHLVTREFPVKGTDILTLGAAHGSGRRVSVAERRPDLSPRFVRVIERATAHDPEARYATAGAMAADLAAVLHPEPVVADTVAVPPPTDRSRVRMALAIVGALVAVVVIGLGAWRSFGGKPPRIESLLVLPLADESRDDGQPYLAAGFTSILAEDIGRIRSLRILTSAQARTGPPADPGALARQVGADGYLEGTMRRGGDRVVLTLRMVETATGAVRWSGAFDRATQHGLSLNREIARAIAHELQVALSPEEQQALNAKIDVSARAQDEYVRGWAEYYRLSRDGTLEAARRFEQARSLEPGFAPAHAALSHVYWALGTSYKAMPLAEARAKAEASAREALELDPSLPNAYAALGQVRFYFDWNWTDAEQLFRRAVDINPNIAQVRGQYGWLLAVMNRLEPSMLEMRAALALEPDSINRRAAYSTVLYYARRYEQAVAEIERAIALDPNAPVGHLVKARYLTEAGRPQDALREIALARYRGEPAVTAELARIHARAGNPAETRRLLPELTAAAGAGTLAKDYLAFVHLSLGDSDRALTLLEAALAERSPTLVWVQVDPRFDSLRSEPRFVDLLRRMGFEQ